MTMPKSTQTRFLGIRDNHNHCTSLRLLLLIIITDLLLMSIFKAYYPWSVLDLYVGEIHVLPVSNIYIIMLRTQKASVGMYSGCDYLVSLKILFVYFLTLSSLLPPSILFNCFYTCFCSFLLHECNYRWEVPSSRVRVKVVATPFVNSP